MYISKDDIGGFADDKYWSSSEYTSVLAWCQWFPNGGQYNSFSKHGLFRVRAVRTFSITISFTCGEPFTDTRDGNTYATVQIGDQCWMAENLNIGERIDGSEDMTDNGTIEKYCYDNSEANCDVYGGLYQWDEMMQYITTEGAQGICMEGWHVPTDAEWCILEQEVDPTINCSITGYRGVDGGTKLKQGGSSGFAALFGGFRHVNGTFNVFGSISYLWSSSESGANAWTRYLNISISNVGRNNNHKAYGFTVRCLKDN